MTEQITTPEEYVNILAPERREAIKNLRDTINANLPEGFEETINYGMIGYVVPHSLYPPGYHVEPELPLPFINIASQKSHIALYHHGLYADQQILDWFVNEYPKHVKTKLDMGKSCLRFKNPKNIPYQLIGELCTKMTPQEWINLYESKVKR